MKNTSIHYNPRRLYDNTCKINKNTTVPNNYLTNRNFQNNYLN